MSTIYFAASAGRIKIGTTIREARVRLAAINNALVEPLVLIGTIEGSYALEKAIHKYLHLWNVKGEWFRDCPEIRREIDVIVKQGAAALGIAGHVAATKDTKPAFLVPKVHTPKERARIFSAMVKVLWPNDAAEQLAALSGQNDFICRRWAEGEEPPPTIVRLAVGSVVALLVGDGNDAERFDFIKGPFADSGLKESA